MITDNRQDLYNKGLSDKEIALATGKNKDTIVGWRISHRLPVNKAGSAGVPMGRVLDDRQCAVMRGFLHKLVKVAGRNPGKKDVMRFMQTFRELYLEGKVMA